MMAASPGAQYAPADGGVGGDAPASGVPAAPVPADLPAGLTSPVGVPLPPDLRGGPVVVGVDDVAACGRPLRAAVFLARSLGRPVLAVHVRRRAVPLVEGYVPIPEEMELDESAEDALEASLSADLAASGELTGVSWELVSTSGDAAAELIRIADERDAACLVVGKRHSGFAEFLHRIASGSVSRAVVASQKFPVMVVP
jgi:nucleotide-binding universal stress UspA family protein